MVLITDGRFRDLHDRDGCARIGADNGYGTDRGHSPQQQMAARTRHGPIDQLVRHGSPFP
jgi:hypothetical protein